MLGKIRQLLPHRTSHPLNKLLISQANLASNYRYLSSISPQIKIAPVLKSNAYGHGIELVGKSLEKEKPPFLCVDSLLEAHQLHRANVRIPILIMGYIDPASLTNKKLPFSYSIYGLELAKAINTHQKNSEIHIFVDTGMHREGVQVKELKPYIKELKKLKNLNIVGLMTHLAIGNEPNHPLTKLQLKEFAQAVTICEGEGLNLKWKHLGGSNAILYLSPQSYGVNLVRAGLALYGMDPAKENLHLKPILKLVSKLTQVKKIKKGDHIGYNATFTAPKDMTIGVLPLGYNDGVDRRLSNQGFVLIKGAKCRVLGNLSMNITTIDLTSIKSPQVGDEVIIFSDQPKDPNSIRNSAHLCQTTPYVLLVGLTPSTKRVLI